MTTLLAQTDSTEDIDEEAVATSLASTEAAIETEEGPQAAAAPEAPAEPPRHPIKRAIDTGLSYAKQVIVDCYDYLRSGCQVGWEGTK